MQIHNFRELVDRYEALYSNKLAFTYKFEPKSKEYILREAEMLVTDYINKIENKIKYVSKKFNIDIEKFSPKDNKGVNHMLGLFEQDEHYDEFITQGAKKYAYKQNGEIHITVAGVPKSRFKGSKRFKRF